MTSTSKTTYQVIEDNGGGLHLYVWSGDELVYGHCGFEHIKGSLAECIQALRNGDDAAAWDGCEVNPRADYDSLTEESRRNGGWRIVYTEAGPVDRERWGAAATDELSSLIEAE